jgi:hypothetical protein
MTESEWLACTDATPMLGFLDERGSYRRYRLFACACVRRVWHLLTDERYCKAIETTECYLDGKATEAAQRKAHRAANAILSTLSLPFPPVDLCALEATSPPVKEAGVSWVSARYAADGVVQTIWEAGGRKRRKNTEAERRAQADILRDIFGNPFRASPPLPPAVVTWNGGTVRRLAEAIYENCKMPERTLDNARLAILADALLDAGCEDEVIMAHCRSEVPHVRGCWAVDLILGKE